jgi:hypothetical protein
VRLVEALERLRDDDPDCQCDDHRSPDCCGNPEVAGSVGFCARCIAGIALICARATGPLAPPKKDLISS